MRKLFLILWILIFGSPSIIADGKLDYATGKLSSLNGTSGMPKRDLELLADSSYRVTYIFESAQLVSDRKTPESMYWQIGGFGLTEDPNQVAIPMRKDRFVVPKGKIPILTVNQTEYKNFNFRLCKGKVAEADSGEDTPVSDNGPDRIVGGYSYFPSQFVSASEMDSYRETEIFSVNVAAIRYIDQPRNIQALTKLVYTISFVDDDSEESILFKSDPPRIGMIDFMNLHLFHRMAPSAGSSHGSTGSTGGSSTGGTRPPLVTVDPHYFSVEADRTYLILTTNQVKNSAKDFIEWKKRQGFNVVVKSEDSWSYNSIKASVDQAFTDYPDLYYLLLLGDNTKVPGKFTRSTLDRDQDFHYSDHFYSFKGDKSRNISDISVGRIPSSDTTVVKQTLNQIVRSEKMPNKALKVGCCANFEDSLNNQFEDRRFVLTAEEIYNYINQHTSLTAARLYGTKSVKPTYWNNDLYSRGDSLPKELQKPQFAWNCNATDIVSSMNDHCNLFVYRGHGNYDRWIYPTFKSTDISGLRFNSSPIIFSICCKTGCYELNNFFAKECLTSSSTGIPAVIAASSYSYSGYNDAFMEGMIDALWPNPGLIPQFGTSTSNGTPVILDDGLSEIGEIKTQGLIRMSETYGVNNSSKRKHTVEVFNLFGDPSMIVHTEAPKFISSDISIKRPTKDAPILGNAMTVDCDEPSFIGIYNKKTGKSRRYYGQRLMYIEENVNPHDVLVSVYRQNCSPYVERDGDIFIGIDSTKVVPGLKPLTSNSNICKVSLENIDDEENSNMQIVVRNNYGAIVRRLKCDGQSDYTIDISDLNSGIYIVSLVKDENIVDSKHFVK